MLVPAAVAGVWIRSGGAARVGWAGVVRSAEIHSEREGKKREKRSGGKKLKLAISKAGQLTELEPVPAPEHWDYSLNQRALFVSVLTHISQSVGCSLPNGPT